LSCTQLSIYILCAMCSFIPRLLGLLPAKKKKKNHSNKHVVRILGTCYFNAFSPYRECIIKTGYHDNHQILEY